MINYNSIHQSKCSIVIIWPIIKSINCNFREKDDLNKIRIIPRIKVLIPGFISNNVNIKMKLLGSIFAPEY